MMMKNQIVMGLGLALCLMVEVSSADPIQLPVTLNEINKHHVMQIDTSSLNPYTSYDITCYANNLHQEENAELTATTSSVPQINMGPALLNGNNMIIKDNQFVGDLLTAALGNDDNNKVVFQRFIINQESSEGTYLVVGEAAIKHSIAKDIGLYGFVLHDCTAVVTPDFSFAVGKETN